MLEDPDRWRQLIAEYGALRQLSGGLTPQARGQRFNGLVAETLAAFGIQATANQRSVGEIDVVFSHAGRRFILEAKWEQRKSNTGTIAKLQRRVEQRMSGVTGVLLAVAGFSDEALTEIDKGRRLDILLLDGGHWDAMLSGLVPPPEMLELITDAASFNGSAYTPLIDLLRPSSPLPTVVFESVDVPERNLVGVESVVVLSGTSSKTCSVSTDTNDALLITLDQGVLAVPFGTGQPQWKAAVSGCSGPSIGRVDGSVIFTRRYGVARYAKGQLTVMSSGSAAGSGQLLIAPDGWIWCTDRLSPGSTQGSGVVTRVGRELGEEFCLAIPGSAALGWLPDGQIVVTSGQQVSRYQRGSLPKPSVLLPAPPITQLESMGKELAVLVTSDSTLLTVDASQGCYAEVGRLSPPFRPSSLVVQGRNKVLYVAGSYELGDRASPVFLMQIRDLPVSSKTGWIQAANVAGQFQALSRPTGANTMLDNAIPSGELATATGAPRAWGAPSPRAGVDARDPRQEHAQRQDDRQRGLADGVVVGGKLPLNAYEEALAANFDLSSWLGPRREQWQRLLTDGTSPPPPEWLRGLTPYLGMHVTPSDTIGGDFDPGGAYLLGFSEGLQEVWRTAVRARLVPPDRSTLALWLRQGTPAGEPALADRSVSDLRVAAATATRRRRWAWTARVALWFALLVFTLFEVAAIAITISGDWEPKGSVGTAIFANLCFGLPFVATLVGAIVDIRRLMRRQAPRPE